MALAVDDEHFADVLDAFGTGALAKRLEGDFARVAPGRRYADRSTDGLGEDARRLPHLDRPAAVRRLGKRWPAGRSASDLRLAAQGAVGRHPQEPGGAAPRDPRFVSHKNNGGS